MRRQTYSVTTLRAWWSRLLPAYLLVLILVLAAACGDDSGNSEDNIEDIPDVDPCKLLTSEEVELALETTVNAPEFGTTDPYQTCTWNTAEASLRFVVVQVRKGVSEEEFRQSAETAAGFLDEELNEIEDLGDAAFELGGFLYAHEGNYEVVLTNVYGLDLEDPDQAAEVQARNAELMTIALSRLPAEER